MKCKNCGTENEEVSFCANCGTKLNSEDMVPEESSTLPNKEEEKVEEATISDSVIVQTTTQEETIAEPEAVLEETVVNAIANNTVANPPTMESDKVNIEPNNEVNATPIVEKKSRKMLFIIIGLVIVGLAILGYFLYEYFCPRLSVTNMQTNYTLDSFLEKEYKIKSSLFVDSKNTIWNLNGYDFYKGKKPESIPIQSGENKLVVTNDKITKTYTFTIDMEHATILTAKEFVTDPKYLDYDGDGIPNEKELELGLSTYTNDTDGDGLYDNVELIMGLDPKVKDDYNEIRSYDVIQDNKKNTSIYVTVKGKGNIANNFLDTTELNIGYPPKFFASDVVKLVTSEREKPEEKTIYFKKSYNWTLEEYSIYDYNTKTNELKELETKEEKNQFYANIEFDHLLFVGKKSEAPVGEYKNQIMILIDNSGSMYPKDYVAEKTGKDLSAADDSSYGNDVEFKRLSLMNALVERLGTEKYEYSVHAFTGSFCDLALKSKDKETIQAKINSLKEDCQNFNGTEMSGAVRKYANTFDFDTPGVKYMIVLTDGTDSGLFTYEVPNYNLSSYKKKGIKIITIGLGTGVKSEYLQRIANGTDGAYLYASDANMLETLIGIIENSIKNQETTTIDDKEVTLIADSGFEVTRDGFSFSNFGSLDSPGGNCYGFSYLTKLIYLNQLPISAPYKSGGIMEENGELIEYTLTEKNQERLKKGNVYNTKLDSEYEYFLNLSELPDDYRYLGEDGIPYLNEKYKTRAVSLGYVPMMKENEIKLTIDGKESTYSKYESLGYLNVKDAKIDDKYKDDYQVLQLINRNYRVQMHHIVNLIAGHLERQMQGKTYDYEKEVKQVVKELKIGSPALLSITASIGNHSVLATKVYKSNDLEEYTIGIYDSNTPGEEGQAHLKRQTMYYPFSETTYYDFHYNGGGIEFTKLIYAGEY